MTDKGEMLIIVRKTENGRNSITVAGKRRGAPVEDAKIAAKVTEWVEVWAGKFGYTSTKVVYEGAQAPVTVQNLTASVYYDSIVVHPISEREPSHVPASQSQ